MKRLIAFVALLSIGLTGVAVGQQPLPPPSVNGFIGDSGLFGADCFFSHSGMDDPIVFPGQPGASHMHDFFGAQLLDAFSTNDSIRNQANKCVRVNSPDTDADKSAYWTPALYVNDQKVDPDSGDRSADVGVSYKTNRRHTVSIRPFPANFRAIAGVATGGPSSVGDQTVIHVYCPDGQSAPAAGRGRAPTCQTNMLRVEIKFGDCSDGRSDSPNHRDHLAYSQYSPGTPVRVCPPSHPIELPQLMLSVKYPTRGGPTARLASGDFTTYHADFMNGWEQGRLTQLVNDCLNSNKYCGQQDAPVPGHP